MSTVTITIKDLPGGKVQVKAEPNLATLAKLRISQDDFSQAEQVAIMALREIHRQFKKAEELNRRGILPS